MSTQNQSEQVRLPLNELKQSLLGRADEMVMLPAVAQEALALSRSAEVSTSKVAEVIERDIKLSTEILAMANSAMFSPGVAVDNLHQAIVRLGFTKCQNLIISSSAKSMLKSLPLEQEDVREKLLNHGMVAASIALCVNRTLNLNFHGEEYTAGLLHDFGRSLLAIADGDQHRMVDLINFAEDETTLKKEQDALGTDHCEFGAWFAAIKHVPQSIVEVIRWHHEPHLAEDHKRLVATIYVADSLANHVHRQKTPEGWEEHDNIGLHVLSEIDGVDYYEQIAESKPQFFKEVKLVTATG